jgi:hypothetical protein
MPARYAPRVRRDWNRSSNSWDFPRAAASSSIPVNPRLRFRAARGDEARILDPVVVVPGGRAVLHRKWSGSAGAGGFGAFGIGSDADDEFLAELHEIKIAAHAFRNETIQVSEASRLTGRTWQTSKKDLERMVKKGVLVFEPGSYVRDPKAQYRVVTPAQDPK